MLMNLQHLIEFSKDYCLCSFLFKILSRVLIILLDHEQIVPIIFCFVSV
jgi:hypothetical protein